MAFNPSYDNALKDKRDNAIQGRDKSVFSPTEKDPSTGGTKRVFPGRGSIGSNFKSAVSKYRSLKKTPVRNVRLKPTIVMPKVKK